MIALLPYLEQASLWAVWAGVGIAVVMTILVIIGRLALAADNAQVRYLKDHYGPLIDRALVGDAAAVDAIVRSPPRYRLGLARLLIFPLVEDRRPDRIAATRSMIEALSILAVADRWSGSLRWWRRLVAVQVFGLLQVKNRTALIVAALDDNNVAVGSAALDALADMHDPATLPAIVVRLNDSTLQRGRRAAALTAFGPQCEKFLTELARVDPAHRLNYAKALRVCGTEQSRRILCDWTTDSRPAVRAAALEALARIGLDANAAPGVISALDSDDPGVRMMAAAALRHWTGAGGAAARLASLLDDAWPVAVHAARALQSMGDVGHSALKAEAERTDLAGVLARQMLWEVETRGVNITGAITIFSMIVMTYFVLWNLSQLVMGVAGGHFVWRYKRRRNPRSLALVDRLASPPLVSVVVPARNEALTIVESVTALLALDYEAREIVVVNDGSSDDTLAVLQQTFSMIQAPLAFAQPLKTGRVRGIYRSIAEPGLVVIDKESAGCKADASNTGINAAAGTLVLVIDADTMLEPDALSRGVLPFLENPETVAVGGYVGISNGSRVEGGRVTDAGMPDNWLARFQIVEYMRSFLLFRLACASVNGVTIVSGAFGMFRRDAVIEVGGYSATAIGEDMDLTIRLQQYFRERRRPIRIGFIPMPVCWTQAPEDVASLRAQRYRWRRGLMQTLWRHRRMIGNPRYGSVGMLVLPFTAIFEGIGPLLEVTGYVATTLAALAGFLAWEHYRVLMAVSVLFGAAITLLAVLLSDVTAGRYLRGRDLALLCAAALLENVGYRQINSWWGCVGTYQAMTGTGGWGPMKRRTF